MAGVPAPSQRQVAYRSYSGPARVTGGAGTGKTVVAVHRARHLAEQQGTPDGSILVTTFTSTLAEDLRRNLELLLTEGQLRKVEVAHVDRVANQVVTASRGHSPALMDAREEKERWEGVANRLEVPFTASFLMHEWQHVIQAQDLRSREEYLNASRTGRGIRLPASQRASVWQAIDEFAAGLARDGRWTFTQVCAEAARLLAQRTECPYRHVLIDEAQDLHPAQWRMLRAAVDAGTDDLFVAGDTHQRIYDNRVSLRSLGINVAGRSSRLRINYRTTAEILSWSLGLLTGERVDDMDGGEESQLGYRSAMHGRRPDPRGAGTKEDELEMLASQVKEWLASDVEPSSIGVGARTNQLANDAIAALRASGVAAGKMNSASQQDAVRVGTMHRMKGLEFRCVGIVGVSDRTVPMPAAVTAAEDDAAQHALDLQRERCLLYVACTRAREALHISWHGTPSPFLPES